MKISVTNYPYSANNWVAFIEWPTAADLAKVSPILGLPMTSPWNVYRDFTAPGDKIDWLTGTGYAFLNVRWFNASNVQISDDAYNLDIGFWVNWDWDYVYDCSTHTVSVVGGALGGHIEMKTLTYDSLTENFPLLSTVPYGNTGFVLIKGVNDSFEDVQMQCDWIIKRPDGSVAQTYSYRTSTWIAPGYYFNFGGPNFILNQEGRWSIQAVLSVIPSGGALTEVDRWPVGLLDDDTLCNVGSAPVQEQVFQNLNVTYSKL